MEFRHQGDVVVKLGDNEVTDMMSYMKALSTFDTGQTAIVTIGRGGELLDIEVTF